MKYIISAILSLLLVNIYCQNSDFLNAFYHSGFIPDNASFKLKIEKLILQGERGIPEILDADNFEFYKSINNLNVVDLNSFEEAYELVDSDGFMNNVVSINILKNKFVTISYRSGLEENFLLNITEGNKNNTKKTIDFQLISDIKEGNYSDESDKDMILSIYSLENECYLALDNQHLDRLGIYFKDGSRRVYSYSPDRDSIKSMSSITKQDRMNREHLYPVDEIIELKQELDYRITQLQSYPEDINLKTSIEMLKYQLEELNEMYKNHLTFGDDFFILRKKDYFMEKDQEVEPAIFLFKLMELSK